MSSTKPREASVSPSPADATMAPEHASYLAKTVARRRRRQWGRNAVFNMVGVLVAAVLVFPVYWMVSTAFKQGENVLSSVPQWIPTNPTLDSFAAAITRPYFWSSVANSLIVVGTAVLLSSVLAFLAAVAVARYRFRGRWTYLVAVILVQMVPLNALIIPLYLSLNTAELTNTLVGVIISYLTFVLPFTVWMLRGFVINVPVELEEAAMVDGCTRLGAFARILLPLVAPGLVATSVYAFITAWNEYLLAYVLLTDPTKQTITVWLAGFTTSKGTDWGPLMAGATLAAIPVVLFFLLVHKRVATGLTAGAVKG